MWKKITTTAAKKCCYKNAPHLWGLKIISHIKLNSGSKKKHGDMQT
jgi:hypothetical protein